MAKKPFRRRSKQLWSALNDPLVLTRCIPGCKAMTENRADNYKVEMQLRVAAVGGSFEGEISLFDKVPPKHLQHQGIGCRNARATAMAARPSRSFPKVPTSAA